MKKLFLSFLSCILCAAIAWAGPAHSRAIKHIQPDGTELSLRLVGDEFGHYYINLADGTKMQKGTDGNFYVIEQEAEENMQKSTEARRQRAQQRTRLMKQVLRKSKAETPSTTDNKLIGNKKAIVILVNFADLSMTQGTQTKFNDKFNKKGYNEDGHIGSVRDYFFDQSYGKLDIEFDVVGPVTLSKNLAYYGGNNEYGIDQACGSMVREACMMVDYRVDFSKYDWNGDYEVDQVFVIFAGYSEGYGAEANTLWSNQWCLSEALMYGKDNGAGPITLDGVKIDTYACSSELAFDEGTELDGIGVICHEFSHCLGLPDLYDTDYSGGTGMSSFDLMDKGEYNGPQNKGEVPAGYSAEERWMFDWLEPKVLSEPANITNMQNIGSFPSAYIIYNNCNNKEYFLLENRQNNGWFRFYDSEIAGHGLFITHIDKEQSIWTANSVNFEDFHQRYTWVPADKDYDDNNHKSDFFPGSNKVSFFTPENWQWAGGKWFTQENAQNYSRHSLNEITENASTGAISFLVDGGDDGTRYTLTFNAGVGSCTTPTWTQSTSREQKVILPEATIDSKEWSFAGWSVSAVSETTTTPVLYLAGDSYLPTKDETLYAVFEKVEEIATTWKKVSMLDILPDGTYAICAPNSKAFNGIIINGCGEVTTDSFIFNDNGTAETIPDGICEITICSSGQYCTLYNQKKGFLYVAKADYGCLGWSETIASKWIKGTVDSTFEIRDGLYAYLRANSNNEIISESKMIKQPIFFVQKTVSKIVYYATNPAL